MTLPEPLETVRRVEVRTNRLGNIGFAKPIEFERFGNCGEFATIKNRGDEMNPVLFPSNSTGIET